MISHNLFPFTITTKKLKQTSDMEVHENGPRYTDCWCKKNRQSDFWMTLLMWLPMEKEFHINKAGRTQIYGWTCPHIKWPVVKSRKELNEKKKTQVIFKRYLRQFRSLIILVQRYRSNLIINIDVSNTIAAVVNVEGSGPCLSWWMRNVIDVLPCPTRYQAFLSKNWVL